MVKLHYTPGLWVYDIIFPFIVISILSIIITFALNNEIYKNKTSKSLLIKKTLTLLLFIFGIFVYFVRFFILIVDNIGRTLPDNISTIIVEVIYYMWPSIIILFIVLIIVRKKINKFFSLLIFIIILTALPVYFISFAKIADNKEERGRKIEVEEEHSQCLEECKKEFKTYPKYIEFKKDIEELNGLKTNCENYKKEKMCSEYKTKKANLLNTGLLFTDESDFGKDNFCDWQCGYFGPGFAPVPELGKPVIYLYPEKRTNVLVKLLLKGEIIADYPKYNKLISGWEVTALPDGRLIDKKDGKEYSYIFWEGISEKQINYDLTKGFVVKGESVRNFLQEKLSEIGLTPKEYNEFIVYWYPLMKNNKYNLIHFAKEEYTDIAQLTINPKPDSLLRVFMVFKALDEPIDIEPQKITPFERNGFTVVEWGGSELK